MSTEDCPEMAEPASANGCHTDAGQDASQEQEQPQQSPEEQAVAEPAPDAAAPAEPAAEAGARISGSTESTTAEVKRLKAILDNRESSEPDLLEALEALQTMGDLPTKVLSDTLIGKTVNSVAKASPMEAVRSKAKELVDDWRQMHRKRKATGGEAPPPLRRKLSVVSSIFSEADLSEAPPQTDTQSEEPMSQGEQRSLSQSQQEVIGDAGNDVGTVKPMSKKREQVQQKLREALGNAEEIETKGDIGGEEHMRDPVILGREIEEALHSQLQEKEYLNQARAVIFNLKDKKNHTFRFKLMVGYYPPEKVPKLSAEDMASDEKNAARAKMRQDAMDAIDEGWAQKHGATRISGMFTCGRCKGTRTTYFQMQTRSSDEPMTTFVTCLQCNNRWKFC